MINQVGGWDIKEIASLEQRVLGAITLYDVIEQQGRKLAVKATFLTRDQATRIIKILSDQDDPSIRYFFVPSEG